MAPLNCAIGSTRRKRDSSQATGRIMYDLEIVIGRDTPPFHATGIATATRVNEIADDFLAAWGIPTADKLDGHGAPTLVDCLTETGKYQHENADYRIVAKRSA
jgi:hypothetical protein